MAIKKKKAPPKKKGRPGSKVPKKKPLKKKVKPDYVLGPGGFRLRGLVKKAARKKNVRTVSISAFETQPPSEVALIRSNLLSANEVLIDRFGPPTLDIISPNWVAYAAWKNNTGRPIARFSANYIVPNKPQTPGAGPIIYIFIGLQNQFRILQPVLQWGISGAGGDDDAWNIGSFFAGAQTEPMEHSELTRVNPGQRLTAVIQLTQASANSFHYVSFFEGFPRSKLVVPGVQELNFVCATLESFGIQNRTDYPPNGFTPITGIVVRDNTNVLAPAWRARESSGPIGEHAVVRRVPGSPDEIDLHFSGI